MCNLSPIKPFLAYCAVVILTFTMHYNDEWHRPVSHHVTSCQVTHWLHPEPTVMWPRQFWQDQDRDQDIDLQDQDRDTNPQDRDQDQGIRSQDQDRDQDSNFYPQDRPRQWSPGTWQQVTNTHGHFCRLLISGWQKPSGWFYNNIILTQTGKSHSHTMFSNNATIW